jgi:hypothetical protein
LISVLCSQFAVLNSQFTVQCSQFSVLSSQFTILGYRITGSLTTDNLKLTLVYLSPGDDVADVELVFNDEDGGSSSKQSESVHPGSPFFYLYRAWAGNAAEAGPKEDKKIPGPQVRGTWGTRKRVDVL